MIQVLFLLKFNIYKRPLNNSHHNSPVIFSLTALEHIAILLASVQFQTFLPQSRTEMVEYYDVLYDYYGEGDAELALVLSVFSVIIGALTWLRKVQSSFLSLSLFFFNCVYS